MLLLWGIVVHLCIDWMLQNDWMALNKPSLFHPAAYVHSGLHFLGLLLIFPWYVALVIAIFHLLIDTRAPLGWWRKFYRQTENEPMALHVAIWSDQVAHIVVLAIASLVVGGLR
jgi:hypothetical protein